jgi:ABC-type Mn2+/Zn2+ transport system ATPase subunit
VEGQAPSITARGVVLLRGHREALRVDRLDLTPGSTTALVGPNGSGKSTFLHAVAGLLRPAAGALQVLGHAPARARARVAYVLQATEVNEHMPVTVGEVVRMGRYAVRGVWGRLGAGDRAAVDDAVERLELGALLGRHLGELSGGQRTRVFVAQGLAQGADVLLLDEPVAGVDLPPVQRIRRVVEEERAAGRTVVVATHDLADASSADRVVLLAGRVVAAGPPEAVLTADSLAEAYGSRLLRVGDTRLLLDEGSHHDHEGHAHALDERGHGPHH